MRCYVVLTTVLNPMLLSVRSTDNGGEKNISVMIALESQLNGLGGFGVFFFFFTRVFFYKLNNKTVSGCEFHRFVTFHNVTYSGFSRVYETADMFVGLDVDCQLFVCNNLIKNQGSTK